MMKAPPVPSAHTIASRCAAAGACVGLIALCGWIFDIPTLKAVVPGMVTLKANTAIGLIVCGLGLWLQRPGLSQRASSSAALACGLFTLLLGALTTLQYAWDADFGIDQFLFKESADAVLTQFPGRMALNTAMAFCASGIGLLAFVQPRTKSAITIWVVFPSATLLLSTSTLAITGYVLNSAPGYKWGDATAMALHTSGAFLLLGISMIARLQERNLFRWSLRGRVWIPLLVSSVLLLTVNVQGWNAVSQMWSRFQEVEDLNESRRGMRRLLHSLSLMTTLELPPEQAESAKILHPLLETFVRHAAEFNSPDLATVPLTELSAEISPLLESGSPGALATWLFNESNQQRMQGLRRDLDIRYQQALIESQELSRQSRRTARVTFLLLPIGGTVGLVLLSLLLIILNREISFRREAETHLSEAVTDLKRSNRELEQFAYVASHDLQEPLRMISSYLELIESRYAPQLDQDGHEFIGYAVDGAHRMRDLINDLLTLSRVSTKKIHFQPVDMNRVAADVLQDLRLQVEELGAKVEVDPLPTVGGDQVQLTLLVRNLVANALKFHGEDTVRIRMGAARTNHDWEFFVKDNGIGIAREHFERVFILFQRLHARDAFPGTGIGLALCRRVVERHGGAIRVESTPQSGSTFYFTLPAKPVTLNV